MAHTVRTNDLQVGMKVKNPILGKNGSVKVNAGEVLSNMHVTKLKKWKGVDAANPRGIEVESSPLHSGDELPRVVDKPWESPLVQAKAKQKLQSSVSVPAILDEAGNVTNLSPLEKELESRKDEPDNTTKRRPGRPKGS